MARSRATATPHALGRDMHSKGYLAQRDKLISWMKPRAVQVIPDNELRLVSAHALTALQLSSER